MLNLGSIIALFVAPGISIALGLLLFARLPLPLAVGLTVSTFLLLFLGSQYLLSMWLKRFRAPATAARLEAAMELGTPHVFGLGIVGQVSCVAGAALALIATFPREPVFLTGCRLLVAVGLLWFLARSAKVSPFFSPPLIASREGIRSQRYVIPWQDVVNVFVGSGRGRPLLVETRHGKSMYLIGGDGREVPCEPKLIRAPAFGMWPEDAAQYLLVRKRLELASLPQAPG